MTELPSLASVCVINDCTDDNTRGRQGFRLSAILEKPVTYVGVPKFNALAAAGNIIDMLDAIRDEPAALLVNVAPRFGAAQEFENGTPFGYFWYRKTLVVTTIAGETLSLVKKFGLVDEVNVLDMHTSVPEFVRAGMLTQEEGNEVLSTQFRSFNFAPRVAQFLFRHGESLPHEKYAIERVSDAVPSVWWVDNFGNAKTTLTQEDVDWVSGGELSLLGRTIKMYDRLKDVPDDGVALIVGSSGIGNRRFLELVVQGKSAAQELGIVLGQKL